MMNVENRTFLFFRFVVSVLILLGFIILSLFNNTYYLVVVFALILGMDFFRLIKLRGNDNLNRFLTIISLATVFFLTLQNPVSEVYFFILLYEIISYNEGVFQYIGITVHLILFIVLYLVRYPIELLTVYPTFLYVFVVLTFFLLKVAKEDQDKLTKLYKRIDNKDNKINNYLEKLKNITKEKTELDIAKSEMIREMTHSIGENYSSIILKLEYLEKITAHDEIVNNYVSELHSLSRKNLNSLREVLSKNRIESDFSFEDEMLLMTGSYSNYDVKIKYDQQIDETALAKVVGIKKATYKISDEFIKTSLKDSNSDEIVIQLKEPEDAYIIELNDNGYGTELADNSYRTATISEIVSDFNGTMEVSSVMGYGFHMKVTIPKEKADD